MQVLIEAISTSFVLGLLTPLTAVCVLPLYPGFISYLAKKLTGDKKTDNKIIIFFGLLITLGIITFMGLIGIIFTVILQESLTSIVGILSPIAFAILIVISLLLLFDIEFSKFLPQGKTPTVKNPLLSAYFYGLFFGGIVIPCQPAFISALFGVVLQSKGFFPVISQFIAFGIGMGAVPILLSLLSATKSKLIINFLLKHKTLINRVAGGIMLLLSLYFLFYDFRILERLFG